ncbi:hypothetical protein, partial [Bacillus amyloliquefaciens]|uniref:hypothetical protein n=1 Tax=Bacillus amyloliquefaciens TaxID=1390 RepID=UPI000A938F0E
KGKVGRSVPASLGDGSTGGEELHLKEHGCFRKTGQVARATRRSVPASLGGGTGDEELQLKERAAVSGKTSGARTNPDPKD